MEVHFFGFLLDHFFAIPILFPKLVPASFMLPLHTSYGFFSSVDI
jgi:hypothetical protein